MENTSYVILSFKHDQGYTTRRNGGKYFVADHPNDHSWPPEPGASLEYMLNEWKESPEDYLEIYSILDKNTGIIYTIGDQVDIFDNVKYITGFDINMPWTGGFGIVTGELTTAVAMVHKVPIKYHE